MNDDALLQYLIEMGAIGQDEKNLQAKQARIDALRSGPRPGMMSSGRFMVAPTMLDTLVDGGGQLAAGFAQSRQDADVAGLGTRRAEVLRRMQTRRQQPGGVDRGAPGWQMTPEL